MSKQYDVDLNNNIKYIYDSPKRETSLLQIKNYSDIINKIIPFFNQYPILGVKSLDFADFQSLLFLYSLLPYWVSGGVAELMKNKEHLTEAGFSEIIKIVENMNLDRKNF